MAKMRYWAPVVDVADMGSAYDVFVTIADGVEVLARSWVALDVEVGARCQIALDRAAVSLWEASSDRTGQARNHGATR